MQVNILKMGQNDYHFIFVLSLSPYIPKKGEFSLQCGNNAHYQDMHSKKILFRFYTIKGIGERYWPL